MGTSHKATVLWRPLTRKWGVSYQGRFVAYFPEKEQAVQFANKYANREVIL